MKYRVVGWTYALDEKVDYAIETMAAENAIIDDIRKNGYLFTGMDHQGCQNCTPVLNDGKKRIFTDREFGAIMSRAHGGGSYIDYAFGFYDELDGGNVPDDSKHFDSENFVPEDISESFAFELTDEQFEGAEKDGVVYVDYDEKLRYIDAGDMAVICCGEKSQVYYITSAEEGLNLSDEIISQAYRGNKEAQNMLNNAKTIIKLTLEK